MASKDSEKQKKIPKLTKEPETIRQKADKESARRTKPTPKSKITKSIHKPLSTLKKVALKEYHPVKAPEKRGVRHLNKRIHYIPKFLKNSWKELKQVTWPSWRDALRLTFAVIVFSAVFAFFVQVLDYIFSKLVKEIILR